MEFSAYLKDLDAAVNKLLPVLNQKITDPTLSSLAQIYIQAGTTDKSRELSVWATDLEQYLRIDMRDSSGPWNGVFGIDMKDYKMIQKLSERGKFVSDYGDYASFYISNWEDGEAFIRCERNTMRTTVNTSDIPPVFSFDKTAEPILSLPEAWLWETIAKLEKFVMRYEDYDCQTHPSKFLHFNIKDKRVEASDSYRLALRKLNDDMIQDAQGENIMLHSKSFPVLKRLLDKKSDKPISVSIDDNYVKICGDNFTYIVKRPKEFEAGKPVGHLKYNNMNRVLLSSHKREFQPLKSDMVDVLECAREVYRDFRELHTNGKTPVIFSFKEQKIGAFIHAERCSFFRVIKPINCNCEDGFKIAFDPNFLYDAVSLIDNDVPICKLNESVNAIEIQGNDYTSLVYPIRLTKEDSSDLADLEECMKGV